MSMCGTSRSCRRIFAVCWERYPAFCWEMGALTHIFLPVLEPPDWRQNSIIKRLLLATYHGEQGKSKLGNEPFRRLLHKQRDKGQVLKLRAGYFSCSLWEEISEVNMPGMEAEAAA